MKGAQVVAAAGAPQIAADTQVGRVHKGQRKRLGDRLPATRTRRLRVARSQVSPAADAVDVEVDQSHRDSLLCSSPALSFGPTAGISPRCLRAADNVERYTARVTNPSR